ncbi:MULTISPECIES: glycosyltransferase [unclassified Thioalkalivibrio]|uniref:glycosyltransferase n=1 Tax=unclassified Thioalkalivibrio TaxID=2621013 RepID=UPI0009D91976
MPYARRRKVFLLFIGRLGGGGAERVFVEYANGLAEAGAEVHLACLEGGGYEANLVPGVQVHKFGTRMRKAALPLFRVVRHIRPDVLLSGLTGANLVSSIVGRLAGVPESWVSVHSDLRPAMPSEGGSRTKLEASAIKVACVLSTRVIAVSEGVAEFLEEAGYASKEGISVVYNPVYHDEIEELAKADLPESIRLVLGPQHVYIVAAGRLERPKGFDLLVEAYKRSGLEQRGVHLVVLGEGSEREALSRQIAEGGLSSCVHLTGFLDNPYSVFAKARALVLSSRWEGFGNVLVEALACGTPIAAFDCPSGPAEVLGDVPGCILVPPGDVDALASAMLDAAILEYPSGNSTQRVSRARLFSREQAATKLVSLIATKGRSNG